MEIHSAQPALLLALASVCRVLKTTQTVNENHTKAAFFFVAQADKSVFSHLVMVHTGVAASSGGFPCCLPGEWWHLWSP